MPEVYDASFETYLKIGAAATLKKKVQIFSAYKLVYF